MPAATRERALQAAVELLGAEGVRALSHARVDERAGLPPGTTSNWFRTRRALLGGVVDWIAERERADFDPAAMPTAITICSVHRSNSWRCRRSGSPSSGSSASSRKRA